MTGPKATRPNPRPFLPLALLLSALLSACAAPPRHQVPEAMVDAVSIPGIPQARFWGDVVTPEIRQWMLAGSARERVYLDSQGIADWPDTSFLALSGGGAEGAFGAGLLCGWTAHGDRPQFRIITGVSTGALIAPFAFVGPDYDHVLQELYTSYSTGDLVKERGIVDGLLSDSLLNAAGLRSILEKYVDRAFLERVAAEYRKGRGLIICTTNMDAQRPVIWAMGAIAASGHPASLQLFRDVMLASAAIPGAFPPVMMQVEAGGKLYDEMHADGGVCAQVFLYPAALRVKRMADESGVRRRRTMYVIRNAQLGPEYEAVSRRTIAIGVRAVSTLIKTQGIGDLYRMYLGSVRDNIDYNLAHIPDDFSATSQEQFDPVYMKSLFQVGYDRAKAGYPWKKAPPGFEPPDAGAPAK